MNDAGKKNKKSKRFFLFNSKTQIMRTHIDKDNIFLRNIKNSYAGFSKDFVENVVRSLNIDDDRWEFQNVTNISGFLQEWISYLKGTTYRYGFHNNLSIFLKYISGFCSKSAIFY